MNQINTTSVHHYTNSGTLLTMLITVLADEIAMGEVWIIIISSITPGDVHSKKQQFVCSSTFQHVRSSTSRSCNTREGIPEESSQSIEAKVVQAKDSEKTSSPSQGIILNNIIV